MVGKAIWVMYLAPVIPTPSAGNVTQLALCLPGSRVMIAQGKGQ